MSPVLWTFKFIYTYLSRQFLGLRCALVPPLYIWGETVVLERSVHNPP